MNEAFGTVRPESIEMVYKTILQKNKITRSYISEVTGLSVVTVGKIIDAFISLKIAKQTFADNTIVGRRSRVISFSKARYCAIYDLTSYNFSLYLCDLNLNIVKEYQYKYNTDYLIDENLQFFIDSSSAYINNFYNPSLCYGCGFLLPGNYDPDTDKLIDCRFPELMQLNLKENFTQNIFSNNYIFGDIRQFYARSIAENLDKNISSLTLFLDRENVSSCYIRGGDLLDTLSFAPFGSIIANDGFTMDECLEYRHNPQETSHIIARNLFEISKAVPFQNVFIFGNLYNNMRIFSALVESEFQIMYKSRKIKYPKVSCKLSKTSCIDIIAHMLRDNWFYKNILGDDNK